MKCAIVFDTVHGNTKELAEHMKEILSQKHECALVPVQEAADLQAGRYDLVIIGSPTHGGRPTDAITTWISTTSFTPAVRVICFDTSTSPAGESRFVQTIIRLFGYASKRMAAAVKGKGGTVIGYSTFLVTGKEGPLLEDQKELALTWLSSII